MGQSAYPAEPEMATLRFRGNRVGHVIHVDISCDPQVLSVHLYRPHDADNAVTIETKDMLLQQPVISRSSSVKENDPLVDLPSDVKEIITVKHSPYYLPHPCIIGYHRICKKLSTVHLPY